MDFLIRKFESNKNCSRGKDQGSAFYFYIPYCEVTNSDQDNTKKVEYFNGDSSQELQTDLTSDYRLAPIPRVSTQGQTALIDSYKNAATSLRDSFEKPEKLSLLLAEVSGSGCTFILHFLYPDLHGKVARY